MIKNLCIRESYQKDNQEKVSWNKIGILFTANEKEYIKLFHIPGVLINVFTQKPKETTPAEAADAVDAAEAW